MLFKDQIEKRLELEEAALREATVELANDLGLHTRIRHGQLIGNHALKQLFRALKITDYSLEEDDFATPNEQLERILAPKGIMKRNVKLDGAWWRNTVGPLLGEDKEGNLITLLPARWGRNYTYINKAGKTVKVNRRRMREEVGVNAICFYPALPQRVLFVKDLLKYLFGLLQGTDVVFLLLISLVISLFGMFIPYVNKQIFDSVIPNGILRDLYPIGGLLIGAGLASCLFGMARNLILGQMKDKIDVFLQAAVMARTFTLHPSFFWKYSSGELSSRITAVSQLCQIVNDTLMSSLLTLFFSFIYFWQIIIYAPSLLMPVLGIIGLQLLLLVINFFIQNRIEHRHQEKSSQLNGMLFNLVLGIQKIKLTGSESRAFTRWLHAYRTCVKLIYNPPLLMKLMPAFHGLCSLGGMVLIYYYTLNSEISTSNFIAFSVAFGMITSALATMTDIIPELSKVNPLIKMSEPILKSVPESAERATRVSFLSGAIEVSNLSFRYAPDSPWILRKLNLKIQPGEYVGIVGKSGCGKSTLLRLLLGFEQPQSGGIYYDNYDLSKVDKTSLRRCIGCCLQSGSLFPGNIFSNITVTAPWSTHEDAWEAARLAGIDQEIRDLPMGMHTLISESGGGFSGGQKQRLLIARALINKPSIILFDEATSALDNISQKQVSDNLDSLGCTCVVIAHRLSTIRHCDRIVVLDKGEIVEEGTFDELVNNGKMFYEMTKRQM